MKKIQLTLFFILLVSLETFAHAEVKNTVVKNGIGLGAVLAVVISWSRNKSVLYAIIHGVLSWFYVIYYILTRTNEEKNN